MIENKYYKKQYQFAVFLIKTLTPEAIIMNNYDCQEHVHEDIHIA